MCVADVCPNPSNISGNSNLNSLPLDAHLNSVCLFSNAIRYYKISNENFVRAFPFWINTIFT